jgi:hypothetical protein
MRTLLFGPLATGRSQPDRSRAAVIFQHSEDGDLARNAIKFLRTLLNFRSANCLFVNARSEKHLDRHPGRAKREPGPKNTEPSKFDGRCSWIPGSPLRGAPE